VRGGADTLIDGRGDDSLTGGSGDDTFIITARLVGEFTHIRDFTPDEDVIIFRCAGAPEDFDDLTFTLVDSDGNPHEKGWRAEYRENHWRKTPDWMFNKLITWGDEGSSIFLRSSFDYDDGKAYGIRPGDL